MKKINGFSSLILLGLVLLVFATSCKKTEVLKEEAVKGNTVVAVSEKDFKYDNTTVGGVFEAAGYVPLKKSDGAVVIPGYYYDDDYDMDNGFTCLEGPLCMIIIVPSSGSAALTMSYDENIEQTDTSGTIFIVAPDAPIKKEGKVKLISSGNGFKRYKIIPTNK
jgi:hypothetical protein